MAATRYGSWESIVLITMEILPLRPGLEAVFHCSVRACVCEREKERGDESHLVRLVEEGGFIFWRGGM